MRSLTIASLVLPASAFLIPAEVSAAESDVVNALPIDPAAATSSFAQIIKLDCPRCPVRMHGAHSAAVATKLSSHLELDFSVQNSNGQDYLVVNGFELYPHADPFRAPLTAPHVVDNAPDGSHRHNMMADMKVEDTTDVLGFSLQSRTLARGNDDEPMELVELDFQIIEVGDVFVDGIPSLQIKVIRMTGDGRLAIASIEEAETQAMSVGIPDAGSLATDCNSFLCKWIQSLEGHWNHWRPHCGASWHRPHGHHEGGHHGHVGHHQGKYHHGYHGFHGRKGSHRTWRQLVRNVTAHIIVPVIIGIFSGIFVSIIGVAVGTFTVSIYRRFIRPYRSHRRHRRHHHSKAPKEAVVALPEEKQGLMDNQELQEHQEHQDPPPSYEEDPENQKRDV